MTSLVATQIIEIQDKASENLNKISNATDSLSKKERKLADANNELKQSGNGMFNWAKNGILRLGTLALAYVGIKSTFNYLIERSKYLVSMQNILHATSGEMEALGTKMSEVSKRSVVSMSEMYHGTFELSRRLRNVNLVSDSIEHVKNIAGSTKQGFTEAAQTYGDVYNAFSTSIKSGNTTLQDIADEVAYSFDKTKGNLTDYLFFIQNSVASIKQNNISLKDASSIYANLLEAGYGGNIAGSRLNAMLLEFSNVDKRKKLSKTLGLDFKDLDIKSKGFINVLEAIKNKTDKMTQTQKDRKIQSIFSTQSGSTLILLTSLIDKMNEYKNAHDKVRFAERGNAIVLQSTYGAWERLKNSIMSTGEAFVMWDKPLATILNTLTAIWEIAKSIMSLKWTKIFTKEGFADWQKEVEKRNIEYEENKNKFLQKEKLQKENLVKKPITQNPMQSFIPIKQNNILETFQNNKLITTNKNQNEISVKLEIDTKDKNIKATAQDIKVKGNDVKNINIKKRDINNG
jgi:TP901 family phage tail tape measure protein